MAVKREAEDMADLYMDPGVPHLQWYGDQGGELEQYKKDISTTWPAEHVPAKKKKKRSRWGGEEKDKTFIPGMPTVIPPGLNRDQEEQYLLQLQIEEISRRLRTGDLGIPPNPEDRFDCPGRRCSLSSPLITHLVYSPTVGCHSGGRRCTSVATSVAWNPMQIYFLPPNSLYSYTDIRVFCLYPSSVIESPKFMRVSCMYNFITILLPVQCFLLILRSILYEENLTSPS